MGSVIWNVEYRFLCDTVDPCWLSLLVDSGVYMLIPTSEFIHSPPFPFGEHKMCFLSL